MTMFGNLSTMGQVSGRDFAAKLSGMSNEEVKAELEEKRKEEEEEKRKQQEYIREQKAKEAEAERLRLAPIAEKGRQQAPTYRDSYEVGELTSFEEAKQAADEVYLQSWYDRANEISSKWTDKDYALIAEPQYEEYYEGRHKKTRRVVPEGYDEYVEAQERINAGPLDFSSEETHKMLIKPPTAKGGQLYGKRQEWIDESNPLRQAVEAQADVMQGFLDSEGISIVQKYEDIEGFDRPDSFRGEGIYLNTGTGAHIDWDAGLKRMQQYQSSPDAELGTYSTVFVRPDPEGLAKPLAFVGAITGNPWLSGASAVAAGGDLEDALKGAARGYVAGQVTAPILENTLGYLGVDADLFGMNPEEFSESVKDIQDTIIEGGDVEKALVKELGGAALKKVGKTVGDMLPDIDLPDSEIFDELGKALKPVVEVVKEGGRFIDDTVLQPVKENVLEPVVDVAQKGIDVVQTATQPISDVTSDIEDVVKEAGRKFDDTFLEPWTEPTGEFLSEAEDVVKDLGREFDKNVLQPIGDVLEAGGDFLGGMLGGGQQDYQQRGISQTPVEQLFDKELFKFDTEIKSTQEMLSPMMNLRRYG
jgi:hypothetical protein